MAKKAESSDELTKAPEMYQAETFDDMDEVELEVSLDEEERTDISELLEKSNEVEQDVEVSNAPDIPIPSQIPQTPNPSSNSTMSKKVFISIDNDAIGVLKLQSEGYDLFFDDNDGRFLELPEEILSRLTTIHFLRYKTSEGVFKKTLNFAQPRYRFIKDSDSIGYGTAKAKLYFKGGDPNLKRSWQYKDQLPYWESMGARVCTDPNVKTFTKSTGASRTITESDGRQLVLVEFPKEVIQRKDEIAEEKARKRVDGFDEASYASLQRSGGKPIDKREVETTTRRLGRPQYEQGV